MQADKSAPIDQIRKAFEKELNSHGYGFQYSILKQAEELHLHSKSFWVPSVPEFPVDVQGNGSRIDFILKHQSHPFFMVAECKRVNPALSNWCFAKASFVPLLDIAVVAFVESAFLASNGKIFTRINYLAQNVDTIYHIALETKSNESGDPKGQGHGEIEQAATQICRGLNGMINFFANHPNSFESIIGKGQTISFLPVIFTTAHLWVSDIDLGSADLTSGKINFAAVNLKEVSWLYYHYNQSPGLKYNVQSGEKPATLEKTLYNEYVRTIVIVGASGIKNFLCADIVAY